MSSAKTIILTRDEAANEKTRDMLLTKLPDAKIFVAPVRALTKIAAPEFTPSSFDGLVVTSANALSFCEQDVSGMEVFCVGEGTALAAKKRGCFIKHIAANARLLSDQLEKLKPSQFLYLRGAEITADFEKRAQLAHHGFHGVITYRATHRDWNEVELARIEKSEHAIFPVLSQASARSLEANFEALSSQFRGEVLPISEDVSVIFAQNSRVKRLQATEISNLEAMIEELSKLFSDIE